MCIAKPTGEHVGLMLDPGGWPEADEDIFMSGPSSTARHCAKSPMSWTRVGSSGSTSSKAVSGRGCR